MAEIGNSRVLVTGAAGFIGSHLTRRLVASGAEVHALTDVVSSVYPDRLLDLRRQITLHEGNIADRTAMEAIAKLVRPQIVFHLAAYTHVGKSWYRVDECIQSNVQGTVNLLLALEDVGYERFIYTGTSEIYGDIEVPFREDAKVNPISPYAVSKYSGERFCRMYQQGLGWPIVLVRPFNAYGPAQSPDRIIPETIVRALRGQELALTSGTQTREFNYVEDIAEGFELLATTPGIEGELFNIGGGEEVTIHDLVVEIVHQLGDPIEPKFGALEHRPNEIWRMYCDSSKARAALGWEPQALAARRPREDDRLVPDGAGRRTARRTRRDRRSGSSATRPISVVIPTRDRAHLLEECLVSLRKSLRPFDELIVADSASVSPDVKTVALAFDAKYIRCRLPGTSRARNAGWRAARHEIVAFVDDDVRVDTTWASALAKVFDDPGVAFVTGAIGWPATEGGVRTRRRRPGTPERAEARRLDDRDHRTQREPGRPAKRARTRRRVRRAARPRRALPGRGGPRSVRPAVRVGLRRALRTDRVLVPRGVAADPRVGRTAGCVRMGHRRARREAPAHRSSARVPGRADRDRRLVAASVGEVDRTARPDGHRRIARAARVHDRGVRDRDLHARPRRALPRPLVRDVAVV